MNRQDRLTVTKFALVCGLAGPAIGLLFVLIAVYGGQLIQGDRPPEGASLLWNLSLWILPFYSFALVYGGLGGIIFGALTTWLLIRKRKHGVGARALRNAGAAYGALFGSMVMPFYFIVMSPFLHGAIHLNVDLRHLLDWATGMLIGGVTGAILGFLIAIRLTRAPEPTLQHGGGY
jgi:hypothetical protein